MRFFPALLLACILLIGCGESLEKKLVGSWTPDAVKSTAGDNAKKSEADKLREQEALNATKLVLNADKTFTLQFVLTMGGSWSLNGNKLSLKPNIDLGGKPSIDFLIDSSGRSMTLDKDSGLPGNLVLVKQE